MQILARFRRSGTWGFGINFIQMALWLAALAWSLARVELDVVGGLLFGVGFLFMAAILGTLGWLGLSSLFRAPAIWVEDGALVCVSPLPVRVRLDDVVAYKFQLVRTGGRQVIWGVRLYLGDGRRRHVNLVLLDGAETLVSCLRQWVPAASHGHGHLEPAAI